MIPTSTKRSCVTFAYSCVCCSDKKLPNQKHYKWKMSLFLFYELPAGAIEMLFDVQNQPVGLELYGAIEMARQYKKPKEIALVKWSSKNDVVENAERASATY